MDNSNSPRHKSKIPVAEFIDDYGTQIEPADKGFIKDTHKLPNTDKCYKTGALCVHGCSGQCKESC